MNENDRSSGSARVIDVKVRVFEEPVVGRDLCHRSLSLRAAGATRRAPVCMRHLPTTSPGGGELFNDAQLNGLSLEVGAALSMHRHKVDEPCRLFRRAMWRPHLLVDQGPCSL